MSAIDTYVQNNAAYAKGWKSGLAVAPAGRVTIVACMDSRMLIGAMLGIDEGQAHIVRNAGGIVTEDVIRSVAISQSLLGTREIMLIHHTDCGLMGRSDQEVREAIRRASGSEPSFEIGGFDDLDEDLRISMARIRESPFIAHTDAVRGFVFDVETGLLREVE